ncbi:MAG TPA: caspase family protein [Cyclobacteriaceae bacterium]|nr:caspase family protein [Cyclobacteriaceae bacterium]
MDKMLKTLVLFALSCTAVLSQSIETVIQKGHELTVLTVANSPDSNLVATGSRDKSAKLWELSTGREVRSFLGHEGSINCIDFTSDGKLMITSSGDQTAKIWEVATGKEIFTTPKAFKLLTAAKFSPDDKYFVIGGYPDEAEVWDLRSKTVIKTIKVNADQGLGYGINFNFSTDGKWLAIGEDNRTANVYDANTWELKYTFNQKEGWCGGCATWVDFSSDNQRLLVASNKMVLKLYDLRSGELIRTFGEEMEDIVSTGFSHDDQQVMVITKENIMLWDTRTGQQLTKVKPIEGAEINEGTFSKTGKTILLACNNNEVYEWNLSTSKIQQTLTGLLNQRDKGGITYDPNFYWEQYIAKYIRFKNDLILSHDGKELIKGKFGTKVKRWDIASGKTTMEYSGHEKAALCYDLSKDGKRMVTGGGDGHIILWDVATGDTLKVIKSYREPIFAVQFSKDEKQVASSSWDASFKVHDLTTGERINYINLQNNSAYNFKYHPNGLYVFLAKLDYSLQLIELDTHKPARDFIGHSDVISSLALSPDGKLLMSTSWDGSARIWDIATGLMTAKFKDHKGPVHSAIFSADGKLVYSAGADRVIRIWDSATGDEIKKFEGHNAEVTSLLLGKDNKMLISHSLDGVTKFWDLTTGKEFFEHIHFGSNEWMVKNPDGYFHGTDEARKYIHFVNGIKTYSVDQFFNEFYRPDLLPKIFQSRGDINELKGIRSKLQNSPPPTVKVAALPGSSPTVAEIFIRVTDNGGGIGEVKLFHNGKNIPLEKGTSGKSGTENFKQTVNLTGGTNTFSATAMNKDRVESEPGTAELFSENSSKSSTCYIVAVGINEYKNPKMALNYARPDAESFSGLIDNNSEALFKDIKLFTLYDEKASRSNILQLLDELTEKVHQEDVFIFYYAGHGSMVDNQFYFIPTESLRLYDQSSLKKDAIDATTLQDKLKNIKALKQLIVMDACQSGGSVELLATRGAAEEKAIAQLSRSAGIHVMASAGSEQFATEFAELGHGLFTYTLITALQGEADGAPKDGKVTIYELKSYLDDQVPELTRKLKGKPQYPYTFSRGQDFPIVIKKQ